MKSALLLLISILVLVSRAHARQLSTQKLPPCDNPCPRPIVTECTWVCGADHIDYCNSCNARCDGLTTVIYEGTCADYCRSICPTIEDPICGVDGNTYNNKCRLTCAGVKKAYKGVCKLDCMCPLYYSPVCGADGDTYSNACFAACAGVQVVDDTAGCGGGGVLVGDPLKH